MPSSSAVAFQTYPRAPAVLADELNRARVPMRSFSEIINGFGFVLPKAITQRFIVLLGK